MPRWRAKPTPGFCRLWITPVLEILKQGNGASFVWNFTYPEFVKAFNQAKDKLKIRDLVPYQMRHSGPSIDRSRQARSLEEVQKRGRWRAHRSLVRYEKAARLAATMNSYTDQQQEYFRLCEQHIEAIILGKRHGIADDPILI